jgi:cysteinyl-tRNA synthetase
MGERRLSMLERELPDDVYVLGVDEHTGMVIDLDAETVTVVGKGVVTIRVHGESTQIASGETFSVDRLRDPAQARDTKKVVTSKAKTSSMTTVSGTTVAEAPAIFDNNLREATDRLNDVFATALAAGDADGAARAALELDDAIAGWSGDTLQSDATDHARAVLRSMITRLAAAATGGLRDPRDVLGPFVQVLLDLRAQVRSDKRFDLSDIIRDRLAAINVEVRDTPEGAQWGFRTS